MKEKNGTILFYIKIGLDIVWYTYLVASAYLLSVFVMYIYGGYTTPVITSYSLQFYNPRILMGNPNYPNELIKAVYENPIIKISQVIRMAMVSFLQLAVIYNLRKVFGAIYRKEPFQYKNIMRLKITALYIALPFMLGLIYSIVYRLVYQFVLKIHSDLRVYGYNYQAPWVSWVWWQSTIQCLGVAAMVYIMAEILNYGLELKKENEEFI